MIFDKNEAAERIQAIYNEYYTIGVPAEEFEDYDPETDEGKIWETYDDDDRNLVLNIDEDGDFTYYLHISGSVSFDFRADVKHTEEDIYTLLTELAHAEDPIDNERTHDYLDNAIILMGWKPVLHLKGPLLFDIGHYWYRLNSAIEEEERKEKLPELRRGEYCFWCG